MSQIETYSPEKLRGRKLGKILWRLGRITEEQLKQGLVRQQREQLQKGSSRPLGVLLVELGFCSAQDVNEALAAQNGLEVVSRTHLNAVQQGTLAPLPATQGSANQGSAKSVGSTQKNPAHKTPAQNPLTQNIAPNTTPSTSTEFEPLASTEMAIDEGQAGDYQASPYHGGQASFSDGNTVVIDGGANTVINMSGSAFATGHDSVYASPHHTHPGKGPGTGALGTGAGALGTEQGTGPGVGEGLDKLKGRRLGKILWRMGKVNEEQLKQALVTQQRQNDSTPLGEILINLGLCAREDVEVALNAQAGQPIPPDYPLGPSRVPAQLAGRDARHGSSPDPRQTKPSRHPKTADISASSGLGFAPPSDAGGSASESSDLQPASHAAADIQQMSADAGTGPHGTGYVGDGPSMELGAFNLDEVLGLGATAAKPGSDKSGSDRSGSDKPGEVAQSKLKGRKLGKILWRMGKVNEEQLKDALIRQLSGPLAGSTLGSILVEMGICTAEDVRSALAAQRGVSFEEVAHEPVELDANAAAARSSEGQTERAPADGGDGAAPGEPLDISKLKGRKLGKILWRMGKVSLDQIKDALLEQKQKRSGMLGEILVNQGYCTQQDVDAALAAQLGIEMVDLRTVEIPEDVLKLITAQTANLYRVIPLEYQEAGKVLKVALDSADNFEATDSLRQMFGYQVKPVITDPGTMDTLLAKYYGETGQEMQDLLGELSTDEDLAKFKGRGESIDITDLQELAEAAPVKKLLNLVLMQAIKDRASDIHFEPFEDEFKMRYRVDGVLYEMVPPPKHIALALASRVKVMSNLDIAERRLPQDGRIALTVHGRPVDLRVSVLPTMFGESVVMRVLDRSNVSLDLDKLGMREQDLKIFRQLIRRPNGIVIVTGPTGSGKTTTLYSALAELNDISTKLITCEDPVEYDIDGIIQVAINTDVGMTFAKALRAILRQDPDVCLVGECRDLETASISVQAALTGHLVFTTLHTNDAPAAIARLLDMGLPPYLITAVVEGVLAQRLVRKICQQCKQEYFPTEENLFELELRAEDIAGRSFYAGRGCDYCNNTGYKGRMGIHEIMLLDDDLRELIMKKASTNVIRAEAVKRGMRNLRESGLLAIYDGMTTVEEVVKETVREE